MFLINRPSVRALQTESRLERIIPIKKYYNYRRLSSADRNSIEQELDKNSSGRSIAEKLGRSNSTISDEIKRNRTISIGDKKGQRVTELPVSICPTLTNWPYVCNGCKKRRYGCSRPFKCEYNSIMANKLAQTLNRDSRKGVDMSLNELEYTTSIIKNDLKKGLSPYQISVSHKELKISESSIYRWTKKGYGSLTVMDLQKQVKYKPRTHKEKTKLICHGPERSYESFINLHQELQDSACEMDTVIGRRIDKQCILSLFSKPSKFQFYLLLACKSNKAVEKTLDELEKIFGKDLFHEIFYPILTDNGPQFKDYKALERSVLPGITTRTRVYYCDANRANEKGQCEKNHVELRKLLPKDLKISFDKLDHWDMAECMSQVNSLPRRSLGRLSPIILFKKMYGTKASDVLENIGVKELKSKQLLLKPHALINERKKRGAVKLI